MTSEKSRAKRAPRGVAAAHRRRATQQLRALAHPLRLRLLEVFALGRRTTMQVAAQMGEPPTRLYHHVHALQRAGILKLVDTRQVRGTTEKYFELARKKIGNLRGEHLTAASRAPLTVIAAAVLDEARAEFLAAIAAPSKLTRATAPVALRMLLTVPPSRLPGVRRRLLRALKDIQRDCKKGAPRSTQARQWALTLALAPTLTAKKTTRSEQ